MELVHQNGNAGCELPVMNGSAFAQGTLTQTVFPHVVLLDEDTLFARVFFRQSQRCGVRVSFCETLEELFDVLARETVHVAIIDWSFYRTARYFSIDLGLLNVPTLVVSSASQFSRNSAECLGVWDLGGMVEEEARDGLSDSCSLPVHKEMGAHVILQRALLISGCLLSS